MKQYTENPAAGTVGSEQEKTEYVVNEIIPENNGSINWENIPNELKQQKRWVLWKAKPRENGKIGKVPHNSKGIMVNDINEAETFDEVSKVTKNFDGVGVYLGAGLAGADLDDCFFDSNGNITEFGQAIVSRLGSYTEYSPSDRGLHVLVYDESEEKINKNSRELGLELANQGKYFTITGNIFQGRNQLQNRTEEFKQIKEEYFPETPKITIPEDSIITRIKNSQQAGKFVQLFENGDITGYESESEADFALCAILAFWTNSNEAEIDSLFRQSALYREKWERQDYRENTINKAIASVAQKTIQEGKQEEKQKKATLPPVLPLPAYHLTDLGNSYRFVQEHKEKIKYCWESEKWLVWHQGKWQEDKSGAVFRLAKKTVQEMYQDAPKIEEDETRKKFVKHVMKSEGKERLKAMVDLAKSERDLVVLIEQLDKHKMLFCCKNGTLNLETLEFYPHRQEDLLTQQATVEYIPGATAPTWERFLERVLPDQDIRDFIQRAVGYSMTGKTNQQCMFLAYGKGANGKSTFLETIKAILGDYAKQADFNSFVVQKHEKVRNDLAMLKGARFVSAVELRESKQLDEEVIKQATGQDEITARFLFKEHFTYKPQFKIWLAFNHKPIIKGTDHAIWRRLKLVPFTVTIPDQEQDKTLDEKLIQELPGILNWCLKGLQEYQKRGLDEPKAVKGATEDYRSEMDVVGRFLAQCCIFDTSKISTHKQLYDGYVAWCSDAGEYAFSNKRFSQRLDELGVKAERRTGNKMFRLGVGLKE